MTKTSPPAQGIGLPAHQVLPAARQDEDDFGKVMGVLAELPLHRCPLDIDRALAEGVVLALPIGFPLPGHGFHSSRSRRYSSRSLNAPSCHWAAWRSASFTMPHFTITRSDRVFSFKHPQDMR